MKAYVYFVNFKFITSDGKLVYDKGIFERFDRLDTDKEREVLENEIKLIGSGFEKVKITSEVLLKTKNVGIQEESKSYTYQIKFSAQDKDRVNMFGVTEYVVGVLEHTTKDKIMYIVLNYEYIVLNYEDELIRCIREVNPSYLNIKILEIIGGD